jgi:hypothetical protein
MTDLGRLSTQYQQASQAASVIEQAVEELHARPASELAHSEVLGGYIASLAGLIDPGYADQIEFEYANSIPSALIFDLSARHSSDPQISERLLGTAQQLKVKHELDSSQVRLIEEIAEVANQSALELSQEILAS